MAYLLPLVLTEERREVPERELTPDELVEKYVPLVHWSILKHLHWGNGHPCYDDAASEGYVILTRCAKAWRPDGSVNGKAGFKTYAAAALRFGLRRWRFALGRNAFSRLPMKGPVPEVYLMSQMGQFGEDRAFEKSAPDPEPSDVETDAEVDDRVLKLLSFLPLRESVVVRRVVIKGETLVAVAADMGLCKERIRQLKNNGLHRLWCKLTAEARERDRGKVRS